MWTSRGSSAGERLDSLSVCWGNALIVLSKALYVIVLCISLHRVLLPHVVSYDEEVYSMRGSRPNILFFLTDDHAAPAIGCYDGRLNQTPNIDVIASGGVRFNRALVTNSLCAPSRATILTGTYSHINGVTTLDTPIDARQPTFASLLHDSGYATAFFGKWHMGHGGVHDPRGFDYWEVFDDQGTYIDPLFHTTNGDVSVEGYATDVLTDRALSWLDEQDDDRPWCLLIWHKAPHRPWIPHQRHMDMYSDPIPVPATFWDDYSGRATPAHKATMKGCRRLGGRRSQAGSPRRSRLP